MKRFVHAPFSTAVAMAAGLLVLLGSLLKIPVLEELLQVALLPWAMALAAFALWAGVFNLLSVHWRRVRRAESGSLYSLVLVVSLVATLGVGMYLGPNHPLVEKIFQNIQVPVEVSLLAVLAVSLLYAVIRLMYRRAGLVSGVFLVTTLLILLGSSPSPFGPIPFISNFLRPWISQVLAASGARGILLGVALGTVATGLRALLGVDRPYRG